jgi:hypothetical protein
MAEISYFLPCGLKSALEHTTAEPLTVTEEIAEIDGFKIPGFALSGKTEDLHAFVTSATLNFGLHVINKALGKQTIFARDMILTGKELRTRLAADSMVMVPPELGRRDFFRRLGFMDDLQATLSRLSDYSGLQILFDVRESGFAPAFPRGHRMLHVVLGASAPGEVVPFEASSMCGTHLTNDGSVVTLENGASFGSGFMASTEKDEVVGQVVGNTLYVFVPLAVQFERVVREQDGLGLFKKALRHVWNAYVANHEEKELAPVSQVAEYTDLMGDWLDFFPSIKRGMIDTAERKARELHAAYLQKLQYVQILKAELGSAVALRNHHDRSKSESEWERLTSNPLLKNIGILHRGLQAVTHPIICEYDGRRYSLGSYIIRLSQDGSVAVWAEKSLHPSGYPHPHIGWSGKACFGNISIAIDLAAIERRQADAIELVLRWLTEGYDPKLAEIPINEWPEEVKS